MLPENETVTDAQGDDVFVIPLELTDKEILLLGAGNVRDEIKEIVAEARVRVDLTRRYPDATLHGVRFLAEVLKRIRASGEKRFPKFRSQWCPVCGSLVFEPGIHIRCWAGVEPFLRQELLLHDVTCPEWGDL